MKETPPTFWDGMITGFAICCAIDVIVLVVLAQLGVISV